MDDYDYYEESPPVPTFSDGSSSGGKGANSRAAASRVSASKSAITAASRASAIMAASIQQLPKNTIITSNGIRNIQRSSRPAVNNVAIKAAQKRSDIIMSAVKPPKPIQINIRPPIYVAANIPETTHILGKPNESPIKKPVQKIEKYISNNYSNIVNKTRLIKEKLVEAFEPSNVLQPRKYIPVKYIKHSTTDTINVNQEALDQLVSNLMVLLRSNDTANILNEFNKYQMASRISYEEPLHKIAFQKALTNKALYLTSDA